jgi:hypothetical protein
MASILDTLTQRQGDTRKSVSWYRNAINDISGSGNRARLMREGQLTARPNPGLLNLFFYDPKYKATLPYYDTFPLVLPVESYRGGFVGLNFHYLPPALRLRFLEQMQRFQTSTRANARFDVSWARVKNLPFAKACAKKYLYSQVRSSFLKIDLKSAAVACFLPVQQFKKASDGQVYAKSRSFI